MALFSSKDTPAGAGRLKGKAALVTGAGTGIGEAIAHKFAREGADVFLVGLAGDPVDDVAKAVQQAYPDVKVEAYTGDVAQQELAEACVAQAVQALGKLDVLVNNAGVLPTTAETPEYPVEAFEQMLHNNIRTTFHMTRAALPHLQKTQGNVVSAGSEAGFNGTPEFTAYGGTKAWVHAFTKGVAVEQAKYGVRANCVCPGPIDTSWTRSGIGPMDKQMEQMMLSSTPLGRRGTPEEMANVYAFLASDEASYVTGALFLADGGITIAHGTVGDEAKRSVKKEPEGVLDLDHEHAGHDSPKPSR